MTLLDLQRALSRILTDRAFQRAFAAGDESACAGYELTPRELDCLRRLPWECVTRHADRLAAGRLRRGLAALPLTAALLSAPLRALAHRFCAEFPPRPPLAGAACAETVRLCEFITAVIDEGVLGPPWARDVVAYERIVLTLGTSHEAWASAVRTAALDAQAGRAPPNLTALVPVTGAHAELTVFGYPVSRLIPLLRAGHMPARVEPLRGPAPVLFHRLPEEPACVRMLRVDPVTAAVVRACDGRRSVAEVLAGVPDGGRDALQRLRQLGVLALSGSPPR